MSRGTLGHKLVACHSLQPLKNLHAGDPSRPWNQPIFETMSPTPNTEQPTRLKRITGALLALHAGDSLGATLEFSSWEAIHRDHPHGIRDIVGGGPFSWAPGAATDDTDLTRAVLLAYRDAARAASSPGGDFDVARAAGAHMLAWLRGDWPGRTLGRRPVDVGGATLHGLMRLHSAGGDPDKAGAGRGRAGNGSLMRCLPTGLFRLDREAVVAESRRISAITHNDVRCVVACAAYNVIVGELVAGKAPAKAVDAGLNVAMVLEAEGAATEVQDAMEHGKQLSVSDMAKNGPNELQHKASGYVLDSLEIAIAAVLDTRPLVDVLVDVVRIGCDTDTNAAIAGGLLGARDGVDALPEEWVAVLQFGKEFVEIATELVQEGQEG